MRERLPGQTGNLYSGNRRDNIDDIVWEPEEGAQLSTMPLPRLSAVRVGPLRLTGGDRSPLPVVYSTSPLYTTENLVVSIG